jgi:hypothetical protein
MVEGLQYFLFLLNQMLFASLVTKLFISKEHNVKRHYKTKHASHLSGLQGQ